MPAPKNFLENKVIIVTGASGGIGKSCSLLLAGKGACVVMMARSEDLMQKAVLELDEEKRSRVLISAGDVTQLTDCKRTVDKTLEKFGRLDVLINNAGVGLYRAALDTSVADFDRVMDVNLYGAVRMTSQVLPYFLAQNEGHVIHVGSVASRRAFPEAAAYCASKFALRGYAEALRQELMMKESSVRISLIYPIATRTKFFEKSGNLDYEKKHQYTNILAPETVAAEIAGMIDRKSRDRMLTWRARIIDQLHFFFPAWIERMNAQALKKAVKK